jgi:hypothetical protein
MWIFIFLFWYKNPCSFYDAIYSACDLQIVVDSLLDPKVGIIYDPKSLIRALADLIERYMKSQVNSLIDTR